MTQRRRKAQGPSEENLKARKRARKPESGAGKPVHQIVQRWAAGDIGAAGPENIKELQQTVGNRAVSRLVSPGEKAGPPAVQREAFTPASEEKELVAGATTKGTAPGMAPGVPMPYPNMAEPPGGASASTKAPQSKIGGSMGNEPGTMKDVTSMTTASNAPGQSSSAITPSAGIVPFQAPGSAEQEGEQSAQAPPQPEEQEAI